MKYSTQPQSKPFAWMMATVATKWIESTKIITEIPNQFSQSIPMNYTDEVSFFFHSILCGMDVRSVYVDFR